MEIIDRTLEELASERDHDEPGSPLVGDIRVVLDSAFRHNSVELILQDLEEFSKRPDAVVSEWAMRTLETLRMRSPTSLKVALEAIRRGRSMTLLETLQMELGIATAYCSGASPDFETGVTAVLIEKSPPDERPMWSPAVVEDVSPAIVSRFFGKDSKYLVDTPQLSVPAQTTGDPMRFALPTERAIAQRFREANSATVALPDLLSHFDGVEVLRPGKQGVREKVLEVIRRRCEFVDLDDGKQQHWIRWVH